MDNSINEDSICIDITFKLENEATFTFYNFPIEKLTEIGANGKEIKTKLREVKWYMFGNYDIVEVFDDDWLIINKTKKKINLVKGN